MSNLKKPLSLLLLLLFAVPAVAQDWAVGYQRGLDNQSSTLTTPTQTMSASTACTSANPSVFTWTSNVLQNGMALVLSGTVCTGFTAGLTYYVINNGGPGAGKYNLAATPGGTGIAGTSAQTPTSTIVIAQNALLASNNAGGSISVPSLSSVTRAANGSFVGRGATLWISATTGFDQATFTVRLYTAAPTFATGAGNFAPWAPATGSAGFIGQFNVTLSQFGDGASGRGSVPDCGPFVKTLAGGSSAAYWDLQYTGVNSINAVSGMTAILTLEEEK